MDSIQYVSSIRWERVTRLLKTFCLRIFLQPRDNKIVMFYYCSGAKRDGQHGGWRLPVDDANLASAPKKKTRVANDSKTAANTESLSPRSCHARKWSAGTLAGGGFSTAEQAKLSLDSTNVANPTFQRDDSFWSTCLTCPSNHSQSNTNDCALAFKILLKSFEMEVVQCPDVISRVLSWLFNASIRWSFMRMVLIINTECCLGQSLSGLSKARVE